MGSIPQSPTSIRPRSRDTGFPEPFCGTRNTTLPHPDADLSPNACISSDDVSVSKVLHRSRRSFLAKHKRTISYGKINPATEHMYSDIAAVVDSDGESLKQEKHSPIGLSSLDGRPSKDGGDSLTRSSASSINDDLGKDMFPSASPKRRSVLQKLRISK